MQLKYDLQVANVYFKSMTNTGIARYCANRDWSVKRNRLAHEAVVEMLRAKAFIFRADDGGRGRDAVLRREGTVRTARGLRRFGGSAAQGHEEVWLRLQQGHGGQLPH